MSQSIGNARPATMSLTMLGRTALMAMNREQLLETIDELQEELRIARRLLAPRETLPARLKLSVSEERALLCLLKVAPRVMERDSIHAAIYNGALVETDIKVVDTVICKIRRKLRPEGLDLKTSHGRGYYAPVELRAALLGGTP